MKDSTLTSDNFGDWAGIARLLGISRTIAVQAAASDVLPRYVPAVSSFVPSGARLRELFASASEPPVTVVRQPTFEVEFDFEIQR